MLSRSSRLSTSLSSATQVELASLHRSALPNLDGLPEAFDLACWSRPARSIGGDVVATWRLGETRLVVCLADVMGHGTPAAVVASAVRTALHQQQRSGADRPAAILADLNRLVGELFEGYFVTATVCVLDASVRTITFAQAGHPALLVRDGQGDVTQLSTPTLPLGLLPGEAYFEQTAALDEGAVVVIYSDGISDALASAETPGILALSALIGGNHRPGAFRIVQRIRRAVQKSAPVRHDDRSVLAVRLPPRHL
jgi:sigma-B regulation protein RsbU (phosphoserine phosphatase)